MVKSVKMFPEVGRGVAGVARPATRMSQDPTKIARTNRTVDITRVCLWLFASSKCQAALTVLCIVRTRDGYLSRAS